MSETVAEWTKDWKRGDACRALHPMGEWVDATVDAAHAGRVVLMTDAVQTGGRIFSVWNACDIEARTKVTETQVEDPKKPGEAAVAADFARIWQWGLEAGLWTADIQPQRFCDMVIGNLAELVRRRELQKNLARDRRAELEVLLTHHNDDLRNLRLEHYEELRTLLNVVRKP